MAEAKITTQEAGPINVFGTYKPSMDDRTWNMLIYGDPGVGKTTLAGSSVAVPAMREVLFLNIEGGVMALSDPTVYGSDKTPDVSDFDSFSQMDRIYQSLLKEKHQYKTLIVDSLSELVLYNVDAIVQGKMDQGGKNRHLDDIFLEDYGTSTKQMRRLVRALRDLPMNVIFTAHAAPISQSPGAPTGPAIMPKLRRSVEGYVDFVLYMYMQARNPAGADAKDKEEVRKLLCFPTSSFIAKDRSPGSRLGKVIVEPTMTSIMARLNS